MLRTRSVKPNRHTKKKIQQRNLQETKHRGTTIQSHQEYYSIASRIADELLLVTTKPTKAFPDSSRSPKCSLPLFECQHGLVNLRGLRELQVLDLSNTTVGDAGLAQLKVLTQQEQDMKTKNPFAVLAETNKRAFVSK
jgi:hypothetical protein